MSTPDGRRITTRILITDAETRPALAVARSLGLDGHEVHVCSPMPAPLAGASRYVAATHLISSPLTDPEGYVNDLAALVRETGVAYVMPITDASSSVLLARREALAPAEVIGPSASSFLQASHKADLLALAPRFGLAVPAQVMVERRSELSAVKPAFPLVVKPHRSTNAQQSFPVRHAANEEELARALESLPDAAFPVLLQERVVGPGMGIFVLRHRGSMVATFAHRRLVEQPPSGGGSAYSESVSADADLVRKVDALLTHLEWEGPAMVEFKRDSASGKAYLMEINGRFWGSLQLAIDAGVDFPAIWMAHVLDDVEPGDRRANYRVGVRLRSLVSLVDHIADRTLHSRRRLSLPPDIPSLAWVVSHLFRWHPQNRFETLRLDDQGPFWRELRQWIDGRLLPRNRASQLLVAVHVLRPLIWHKR